MKTKAQHCTAPKKHRRPARTEECGAPAFYVWTPRNRPDVHQAMCRECGEASAGNFPDELTRITPLLSGVKRAFKAGKFKAVIDKAMADFDAGLALGRIYDPRTTKAP